MNNNEKVFDGVVGGDLPVERLWIDDSPLLSIKPESWVDEDIALLMALYPEATVKFRYNNFQGLDEQTKRTLFRDMQELIGISLENDE